MKSPKRLFHSNPFTAKCNPVKIQQCCLYKSDCHLWKRGDCHHQYQMTCVLLTVSSYGSLTRVCHRLDSCHHQHRHYLCGGEINTLPPVLWHQPKMSPASFQPNPTLCSSLKCDSDMLSLLNSQGDSQKSIFLSDGINKLPDFYSKK